MPLFHKFSKRFDFWAASVFSVGVFFLFEGLMETKILVQSQEIVFLESWQMSLCIVSPELYETRTWEAMDVLLGGCSILFLGMCIWACFTAFYRTGELTVSALSAVLMTIFFIVFGVTMGAFTGSYTLGKRKVWSVFLPALVSSLITLIMYIGEMILLSGHLYRFGAGFFFQGLPLIVLAPADIFVILLAGCISAGIFYLLNNHS